MGRPNSLARGAIAAAVALLASGQAPARAVVGTLDATPAATILVPYVEVDLTSPLGTTTLVTLEAPLGAALVHATLWTDLGVPVLGFDLFLPAHGSQTLNLRDVLTTGATSSAAPSGAYAGCGAAIPPLVLDAPAVARLRAALTGQPLDASGAATCAGAAHGDQVARGYLTVDVVTRCAGLGPADADYFAGGAGRVASDENLLVGSFQILEPSQNLALGDRAVALEADPSGARTREAGRPTFYGALSGFAAADHREPLPTRWSAPFVAAGTGLVVWRDPKTPRAPFPCATPPDPLPAEQIAAFDLAGGAADVTSALPLPLVTQRLGAGAPALPFPWRAGWLSLALGHDPAGVTLPAGARGAAQAYVLVVGSGTACGGEGRFLTGYAATPLDSGTAPDRTLLALPGGGR
ncbi:MAG: hypothetical protein KC635_26085 [Myxococcales bacterium]|nr:hypothetical protein [Myxococcales bacterium]